MELTWGKGLRAKLAIIIAAVWTIATVLFLFRVFIYFGIVIYGLAFRAFSVGLITTLAFLVYPPRKGMPTDKLNWYDIIPILFVLVSCIYIVLDAQALAVKWGRANTLEMILGGGLILCLLEATRRAINLILAGILLFVFFYLIYSNYFPGILHGGGMPYSKAIGWMYLSAEGIWGPICIAVVGIVAGYIVFAVFLRETGAGAFFMDLAMGLVGHLSGGVAKASVVGSSLFGTISGIITANVATTGMVTIPLMKRTGFDRNFAGAVESCASCGGAIMPPVMGAVAFLIAEFLNMPYWRVCVAAFIPAIIYYLVLFVQIDREAARLKLKGLPRAELPSVRATLRGGWQYLIPIAVLVFFLGVLRYTAMTSVLYSLVVLLVISLFKKETRLVPRKLMHALGESARSMLVVIPPCAAIGILVGGVIVTGMGINLSALLLSASGGNLLVLLAMAAVVSFILGMGSTAMTVYIIVVILLAPALINAGVIPIAAHMFLFYWGLIAFITPPVCIAAFVAASIAEGDPWLTGFRAMRLGIAAYVVPWALVFNPGILMIGSPIDILIAVLWVTLGGITVAIGAGGYLFSRVSIWESIILVLAGICLLIVPNLIARIVAFVVVSIILAHNFVITRRSKVGVIETR